MRVVEPTVQLRSITPSAALDIEDAGRTCYKSEEKITPGSAEKFVAMVQARGHHSVIEHAYASFRIVTDRGITHEIVRHRLASYSQESTRYCNYSKDKFGNELSMLPPSEMSEAERRIWDRATRQAEENYMEMLAVGGTPQRARSVLLTCQKTEIVMTANFREWLHFLELRTDPAAHPDMQVIAVMVGHILARACPEVFGAYAAVN